MEKTQSDSYKCHKKWGFHDITIKMLLIIYK